MPDRREPAGSGRRAWWRCTPAEAVALQRQLSVQVVLRAAPVPKRLVGLDCAFLSDQILAVAVVWDTVDGATIETRAQRATLTFPYVPGLLSFREVPVLLRLLDRIRTSFGGMLCDGQGIAHPRGLGLASHLGLLVGIPAVGCAKSRLYGHFEQPGPLRGNWSPLCDREPVSGTAAQRIGTVLRTRDRTRPLFVSPGHLVDHASSIDWVLACGRGYRLPEPTRLADRLVATYKRTDRYRGGLVSNTLAGSRAAR